MNHEQMLISGAISTKIFWLRDVNVMLDYDLADLYEVETKRINEQVKRNLNRFPSDFMFQITEDEAEILKSQNATSSWGGRRTLPDAPSSAPLRHRGNRGLSAVEARTQ